MTSEEINGANLGGVVNYKDNSSNTWNKNQSEYESNFFITTKAPIDRSTRVISALVGVSIIFIIVGVLVVCFTAARRQDQPCKFQFQRITGESLGRDSHPSSMAIGYFNNDTQLDVVVANFGTDTFSVFIGDRDGGLSIRNIYSTGLYSSPTAVTTDNLNEDQQLDIVVANFGTHSLGIFVGGGDGTFISSTMISTGSSRPLAIAIGDFNADRRMDVATTNSGSNTISLFAGIGNGSFVFSIQYSTGYDSSPYAIIVGNFNNDHALDIVVGNSGTSDVSIFLGLGNGTFSIHKACSSGPKSQPYAIAIGDFTGDDQLDIIVASSTNDNILVFRGHGNGTFAAPYTHMISFQADSKYMVAADLDGDKRLDIALANSGTDSIGVLLGYGNGSFAKESLFSTGVKSNPFSLRTGDFNNDQRLDIVVANQNGNSVNILYGYGLVPFSQIITYSAEAFSSSTAVAVGDFNNDNRLDIAVTSNLCDCIGILLNNGDGTFEDKTIYDTELVSMRFSLALADFNKDGQLDIVVANSGLNSIGIYFGYGDGNFTEQITYSTGSYSVPISVATGDFNNDDLLDIAVVSSDAEIIVILLGDKDGTFLYLTTYSTEVGARSSELVVNDLNDDHHLDIIVCNSGTDNIGVLLGYGNGTFQSMIRYPTGNQSFPMSAAFDDFNNDHIVDIVVANFGTNNIGILLGQGNAVFAPMVTYSTGAGTEPRSVTIGDFNNDQQPDIFVANYWSATVSLFIGFRDGTFAEQAPYSLNTSILYSIVVGDFNNDHQLDTVVAAYDNVGLLVTIGCFQVDYNRQVTYSTGSGAHPRSLTVGDFNHDNYTDLVVVNYGSNSLNVLRPFDSESSKQQIAMVTGLGPVYVMTADFDYDQCLDVFVANTLEDSINIFYRYENFKFQRTQTLVSLINGSMPVSLALSDLNHDKRFDLIVANQGTSTIGIYLGFEYVELKEIGQYTTGSQSNPQAVAVTDFNNDSRLDIIVINNNSSSASILLGYGNGTFGRMISYSTGDLSFPTAVAVGDLNNDFHIDFVVCNSNTYNLGVFFGYGNGTFVAPVFYSTGDASRPISVAINDFNNDAQLDIIVINQWSQNMGILYGYGDGTFQSMIFYSTGNDSAPYTMSLGDFNNDHQLDVAIMNGQSIGILVFLGNDNKTFADSITSSSGDFNSPNSMATGDLNDDGLMDIVLTDYSYNTIAVFIGFGNGTFEFPYQIFTGYTSMPSSIATIDLNNDGKLDIVVTLAESNQVGLLLRYKKDSFVKMSTYFTGDSSNPIALAFGDFNGDYQLDAVVANAAVDNIVLFLGYLNRGFLPETVTILEANSQPSSLVIADFNNDSQLDIVVAKSGTHNIGMLFGHGDATFDVITDYSTGEQSSPCSLAVGDFNNDHQSDIIVANAGSGNIGVFFTVKNGTLSKMIAYYMKEATQPIFVATNDLNNDTYLDLVVADSAQNNIFIFLGDGNQNFTQKLFYPMGFNARPCSLAITDLNNDQRLDIVVANFGSNSVTFLLNTC